MSVFLAIRLLEEVESDIKQNNYWQSFFDFSPMIRPNPNFLAATVSKIESVKLTIKTAVDSRYGFIW